MMPPNPSPKLDAGLVELRHGTLDDADALAQAVSVSLDHLRPWMPWASPEAATPAAQRGRLAAMEQAAARGETYEYLMVRPGDGLIVGVISLIRRVGPGGLEIGYWVRAGHTGRGYATVAARALTNAGLALPDVHRIEIHCDRANTASQAVPRRLGYRLDRVHSRSVEAPGEIGQEMVWARETSIGQDATAPLT